MNKAILLPLFMVFILSHFGLNAQNSSELKCTMSVEEILLQQPFDIDDAKSEDARNISISLIDELKSIYEKVNTNVNEGIELHLQAIDSSIKLANDVGMNYTMFKEDLEFIETLK
jgi:hypothetical protein